MFDKSRDVSISVDDDDGEATFMYHGADNKMHKWLSQSCDVDSPPIGCNTENLIDLEKESVLKANLHPVHPSYKVVLPDDSTHLLSNAITVRRKESDDETRTTCAIEVCKQNATACPASYCERKGGLCVPSSKGGVSSIQLHDV